MTRRDAIVGLASTAISVSACTRTIPSLDADVIVIGAGLSGLYAAMLLQDDGLSVLVLEADNRVGGRMMTLDHGDGYTEGGGQQIGASYARVLSVADQLGVPLYEETGPRVQTGYFLNDRWMTAETLDIPAFPKPYRNTPPASVLFRLLAQDKDRFDSPEAWLSAPASMDISAADYLSARGFDTAAQALIERTLNANNLRSYSMLNLHRTMQLYRQSSGMGATKYVEGGSQRLLEAMANSLTRPVRLNSKVTSLAQDGSNRVSVSVEGGRALTASFVISTLPFSATHMGRRILTSPDPVQNAAMAGLPYTQIRQHHFRAEIDAMIEDGLPPSIWTDSGVERLFADTGRTGQFTGFARGWQNGDGTKDLSNAADYLSALEKMRPGAATHLQPLATVDWTSANPLAGGAYYHWAPGQAKQWAMAMRKHIGRIHLAGEHLGLLHTGMEAAMESAEAAALAITESRGA